MDDRQVSWILRYIWKGRNNKKFSSLDINPMDTLNLAEAKSIFWAQAHILNEQRNVRHIENTTLPVYQKLFTLKHFLIVPYGLDLPLRSNDVLLLEIYIEHMTLSS